MSERPVVIAIDGPAGAGKSTVSKLVARRLGLSYLDTGAMYRVVALKATEAGIDPSDGDGAAKVLESLVISFGDGEPQRVLVNGEDVTDAIRTPEIGELASTFSAHSPVRRALVVRQQEMVANGGVILEGRDATTVIAPQADVKIYLTASLEERAKRRFVEFEAKGIDSGFQDVRTQILQRDHRDITREDSPLKVADGAVVIESAGKTVEQVVDEICALVR